jgi:ketosteroid isomerase-like protein
MKFRHRRQAAIVCLLGLSAPLLVAAQPSRSLQQDREGIEALHRLDIETTLSGKADELAKLWDKDAVRLLPGSPAEIGKRAIYTTDKREELAASGRNVCYRPEIRDLEVAGDWAFEWGYFSYKETGMPKPIAGKVLRIIKRQTDGSWKFFRVMAFADNKKSAAPLSNPCR